MCHSKTHARTVNEDQYSVITSVTSASLKVLSLIADDWLGIT